MANTKILFSKICPLEDLTCFYCIYNINEKKDKRVQTNFHFQILKCRMLIFSSSQILATPNPCEDTQIIVIYNRNVTESNEIRNSFNELNLQVQLSTDVTPELLELCFKYTLTARIAPLWNRVDDNVFIKGREFLLEHSALEAITLTVHSSENVIRIVLKCFKVNLQHMDINDLNIPRNSLNYFNSVADAVLSEYSFFSKWVHVLPSLKKGRIVGISRTLPAASCFKNYQDLRRYWKNVYGYRLPMDDKGILYYDVHFRPLGPHIFTYPSICLKPNAPIRIIPSELLINKIANEFIKDVHIKLSNILGYKTDFKTTDPIENIPYSNIENIPSPFTKLEECKNIENFNSFQHNTPISHESYKCASQNINLCIPMQKTTLFKPTFLPKKLNYFNSQHSKQYSDINLCPIKNNGILRMDTKVNEMTRDDHVSNNNLTNQEFKKEYFNKPLPQRNDLFINHALNISPNEEKIENSRWPESSSSTNKISKEIGQDFSPIFNIIKGVKKNSNMAECLSNCKPKKTKKSEPDTLKIDEVTELAKTNPEGLKKMTIPTLYSWIISNNHYIAKKATKPQIIEKILSILKE